MHLRSIYLENFRLYKKLKINITKKNFIILTGKNGAGKTNLFEAISFLSPGRGFRNSDFLDILNKNIKSNYWLIKSEIEKDKKNHNVSVEFYTKEINKSNFNKKVVKIDKKKIKNQSELLNAVSLIWLIPEMDVFFRTTSSMRRKFIDRLIFNLQPDYLMIVRNYDKNLKERNKILKNISKNGSFYEEGEDVEKDLWLKKIEEKIVRDGIKIYLERLEFIRNFNNVPTHCKNFPKIKLISTGDIEDILISKDIDIVKEIYLKRINNSRKIDSLKGGISYGPNKSDLNAIFIKKNLTADKCSTGEQKIILITIIIQFCKLMFLKEDIMPILLLDEIIAHLDTNTKNSLFEELKSLKTQIWMSGSDKILFKEIIQDSENLEIEDLLKQ